MTALVLFSAHPKHFPDWRRALPEELARRGVDADVLIETDSPESIDYIAYARDGSLKDFSPFTRLKAVLSLWAGIEDLVGNRTISCPVARMVDAAMTEGMTEWVTAQVLRHHLGLDRITGGQDGVWRHELIPPLARNRTVAVLGLGELGCASAASLSSLKFRVIGWSRTPKAIPGIDCRHGRDGLVSTVEEAEITALLLPHTQQTEHLVDAGLLARFRPGSVIINSGRGALIDEDALLASLDSGHIAHATLDVFQAEPLPPEHRFWSHESVTVSPHVASDTHADTAAAVIAENVRRGESGEPLLYLADKSLGY